MGILVFLFLTFAFQSDSDAAKIPITILHTNDLHSHWREDRSPLGLGGLARIATVVKKKKEENPNTLVLDAGDWSEGGVHYFHSAGTDSIKLLSEVGYDAAVVGNHDWLNGPDHLLRTLEEAQPKTSFVSANLLLDPYQNSEKWKKWIQPYVIRNIQGVKVALLGLSTYNILYLKYLLPIEILDPREVAKQISRQLKEEKKADIVIAISHNSIEMNQDILKSAPDVDLLISGHKHRKLIHPIVVERDDGSAAWLVETGCWGRYLGQVDLLFSQGRTKLLNYHLIQMDSKIPKDPGILDKIEQIENQLENRYGPIFHDSVVESKITLPREGLMENSMGDLVADAFLKSTQADLAVEMSHFIPEEINPGILRTADIMDMLSHIYNPAIQKTWTIKTMPIQGRTLKWLLHAIFLTKKVSNAGHFCFSGLHFVYDPFFSFHFDLHETSFPQVQTITVQGLPLKDDKTYTLAMSNGVAEAIDFIDKRYVNLFPLDRITDTEIEEWRSLRDYLGALPVLSEKEINTRPRIQTLQPDLAIYPKDITWQYLGSSSEGLHYQIHATIKNEGVKTSPSGSREESGPDEAGPQVHLWVDARNFDGTIDPQWVEQGKAQPISSLTNEAVQSFSWDIFLPENLESFSLRVGIDGSSEEVNHTNDQAIVTVAVRPPSTHVPGEIKRPLNFL